MNRVAAWIWEDPKSGFGRIREIRGHNSEKQRVQLIKSVKNGPELFFVLGLRKRKNVVLAKSTAVYGEAESEAPKILIEFGGPLFRDRYQCFITIRHERARQALHGVGYSKVLTKNDDLGLVVSR
jgi:hypothetical protein